MSYGGIEVAYEFKDKCDFIVASPAEILATGFPYDRVIEPLFDNNADLEEVCKRYYDYYNSQSGVYKSGTIALYNTSKLDAWLLCAKLFSHLTEIRWQHLAQKIFRGISD